MGVLRPTLFCLSIGGTYILKCAVAFVRSENRLVSPAVRERAGMEMSSISNRLVSIPFTSFDFARSKTLLLDITIEDHTIEL